MARKESPENQLAAIATVAAIGLVLVQTITDHRPSSSPAYASREASESRCPEPLAGLRSAASPAVSASTVRVNCVQAPKTNRGRVNAG